MRSSDTRIDIQFEKPNDDDLYADHITKVPVKLAKNAEQQLATLAPIPQCVTPYFNMTPVPCAGAIGLR